MIYTELLFSLATCTQATLLYIRLRGLMVSTLAFPADDPGSNLGAPLNFTLFFPLRIDLVSKKLYFK